jgi:uncharacterized protein (DUF2267 family)
MEKHQSFLDQVMANSNLKTDTDAQKATNIVFRILRDMLPREQVDKLSTELREDAPKADMEIKDLWKDVNPMVSFFSYISPIQQIEISKDTFMMRLKQEAALPDDTTPETVAKAVFGATKKELSSEQIDNVTKFLSEEIRPIWQQA